MHIKQGVKKDKELKHVNSKFVTSFANFMLLMSCRL